MTLRAALLSFFLLVFPIDLRALKRFLTIIEIFSVFLFTRIFNLASKGLIFCIFSNCTKSWHCSVNVLSLKYWLKSLLAHNRKVHVDLLPSKLFIMFSSISINHLGVFEGLEFGICLSSTQGSSFLM